MNNLLLNIKETLLYNEQAITFIIQKTLKNIVVSPIYFRKNSFYPCFCIFLSNDFFLEYCLDNRTLRVAYPNSENIYIYSQETSLKEIYQERNLFVKIQKQGIYTCNSLDDIPELIQQIYEIFFYNEFNEKPKFNFVNKMKNEINELIDCTTIINIMKNKEIFNLYQKMYLESNTKLKSKTHKNIIKI